MTAHIIPFNREADEARRLYSILHLEAQLIPELATDPAHIQRRKWAFERAERVGRRG